MSKTQDRAKAKKVNPLEKLRPMEALQYLSPKGPWSLVGFDPNKDSGPPFKYATFKDGQQAEMRKWFKQWDKKLNIYFHANELVDGFNKPKASKSDVAKIHFVQADIDIKDKLLEGEDWSNEAAIQRIKGEILKQLRNYPLPATTIVFSGGGFQAFWRLSEPMPASAAHIIEAISAKIAEDFGGDKVQRIDHIFRCPGVHNIPNPKKRALGRKAELAFIVEHHEARLYSLKDFPLPEPREYNPAKPAKPIKEEHVKPLIDILNVVLYRIGSNCSYQVWFESILAVQDFSGGDTRFLDMLHEWSSRAANYDKTQLNRIWAYPNRENTPEQRFTINTLFHHCREKQPREGFTADTSEGFPLEYLVQNLERTKGLRTKEEKAAQGAPFEEKALAQAALLKHYIPAEYFKLKAGLKEYIGITAWEKEVDKVLRGDDFKEEPSDKLLEIIQVVKLSHTSDGVAIATIEKDGHEEHYRVGSVGFNNWLSYEFYNLTQQGIDERELKKALNTIKAKANHEGELVEVFLRVAKHNGKHYLDLCNSKWEAVEIDTEGWRVIVKPPVIFIRNPGMLEIAEPEADGDVLAVLKEYRSLLNLVNDGDFCLIISWLLSKLKAYGPYASLFFVGPPGAGKTETTRQTRNIADPHIVALSSPPKNDQDLYVGAKNKHVYGLDNVRSINPNLSDNLSRISTGIGDSKRKLFSDDDEVLTYFARPIIGNGIGDIVRQPDLKDRSLIVELAEIPSSRRKTAKVISEQYDKLRPKLLGALLDIFVHGLNELPHIEVGELPRMADFAEFAIACEGAYVARGTFAKELKRLASNTAIADMEDSPMARAIMNYLKVQAKGNTWRGSSSELMGELKLYYNTDGPEWPRTDTWMGRWISANAENLRKVGIEVAFGKRRSFALALTAHAVDLPKAEKRLY